MHIISVLLSLYFQFIHRNTVQKTIQRGKMKKIINILVAAICIFSLTLPVSAEEPKEIVSAGFSKNVNYYKYVYDSGSFTLY